MSDPRCFATPHTKSNSHCAAIAPPPEGYCDLHYVCRKTMTTHKTASTITNTPLDLLCHCIADNTSRGIGMQRSPVVGWSHLSAPLPATPFARYAGGGAQVAVRSLPLVGLSSSARWWHCWIDGRWASFPNRSLTRPTAALPSVLHLAGWRRMNCLPSK